MTINIVLTYFFLVSYTLTLVVITCKFSSTKKMGECFFFQLSMLGISIINIINILLR